MDEKWAALGGSVLWVPSGPQSWALRRLDAPACDLSSQAFYMRYSAYKFKTSRVTIYSLVILLSPTRPLFHV